MLKPLPVAMPSVAYMMCSVSLLHCTDFEMPRMNGPDATEKIRELGFQALIIGVTGNVLAEDVNFFLSKGANRVLPKPVSMDLLNEAWKHPNRQRRKTVTKNSRPMMLQKHSSSGVTSSSIMEVSETALDII